MTEPAGRARCGTCLRPQSACICQWIRPVAHEAEVLILQHPLEAGHAKNTGRLLHMSLPRSRMLTGEIFEEAELRAAMAETPAYTVLLYPPTSQDDEVPALDLERLKDPSRVRLVVLDATWRKSRKMLHLNPLLRRLPRLSLEDVRASAYLIRKAHKPGQLSTLEAACVALAQLEGDAGRYQPLLQALDGFVAQQQAFLP
ncbi:tRNA-uridine aminocarboxypropyltransferase [Polaromonas sp. CT11-55]|uniref:tRNA-uridine aminocarboxypropyltransferase n=1 Tax=Polaromonas sp. CT11-55 TaxID=3243045 RepID=UPI0039A77E12